MVKIATILIEKETKTLNEGVLIMIHDELLTQYKEEEVEERVQFVENSMLKAGTFLCSHIPMNAVGEIGDYWIH